MSRSRTLRDAARDMLILQDAETEAVAQDQNEYIEMRLVAELLPKSGKKAREEHRFGGTLGTCVWHVKRMASIS